MDVSDVQVIDGRLLEEVATRAEASARRRMNFNFHAGAADNPHRFLNVLLKGTYIRPHRHADPPKTEAFLVLEGVAEVIVFEDDGAIRKRYRLGDGVGNAMGRRSGGGRLAHRRSVDRPGGLL